MPDAKKNLLIACGAWCLLAVISWWAAIYMQWGPAESAHDPASVWMYVRRGLLLAGAVLLPVIARGKGAGSYGWGITGKWLCICLPLGFAMGFGNPGGFDPRLPSAIALACMHAFATEMFFRGYLITAFSGLLKKFWPPVILSSVLYGLFYLTVATTWQQPGARKLVFAALFTCIGMLHGYCYKKSGSIIVPWLIHFLGVLKYQALL